MDQLRAMRVFAGVIDAGSFNGAATALRLSPAAVTRLVAELEDHLGARLINRTTRRLALTEIGEAYLDKVRRILADIDESEALTSSSRWVRSTSHCSAAARRASAATVARLEVACSRATAARKSAWRASAWRRSSST